MILLFYMVGESMNEKPKFVYILVILWLLLSTIFIAWASYSVEFVLDIPGWEPTRLSSVYPMLYVGNLISMTTWLVFALVFFVFSYGTFKGKNWVWTAGIMISTIFIVIFGLMLASFMVTVILFRGFFTIAGLNSVIISFLVDLGVIYCLTRPIVKVYFKINLDSNIII